ncbi:hypothetical protein NHF50_07875 [Flavobacterium sp. NRK F10]|uniref:Uncharacterized protein n=1 Tax=Flavobacterium sediminis TaxID=2201181 RepID=A0A2U8QUK3_9FLAO|nr:MULTISPECIES: hypothetical protein [Flavobacterium]AWM13803.1 hypothetical protein DI487_07955 [Flavobacterium sediminis]MCO6174963.1 hypothetical protein [Flavobacterium sp. NRK F10]
MLHKIVKIIAVIISVLSLVFLGGILASEDKDSAWISPLINVSYFIFAACVAVVVIYVVKNLFSKKETLKKTLVSVGLFLAVVVISFVLADSSEVKTNSGVVSGTTSKLVSTGLNTFYLLAIVAVGTMLWTGFNKIKK